MPFMVVEKSKTTYWFCHATPQATLPTLHDRFGWNSVWEAYINCV